MDFKIWLESSLKDIIEPVPQSAKWHSEGSVLQHTQLVRRQLNGAISHLQHLTSVNPLFSKLDTNFTEEDVNILRIGALLHDIGKASATTIDGFPGAMFWQNNKFVDTQNQEIHSYRHEDPKHFEPMMKKLGPAWHQMYENAAPQDKEDLWFIIEHHMDLKRSGFSKKLLKQLIDHDGNFANDRKVKLLLTLILMDKTGRKALDGLTPHFEDVSKDMTTSALAYQANLKPQQPKINFNHPKEFVDELRRKGVAEEVIKKAVVSKFGRTFEEEGWL